VPVADDNRVTLSSLNPILYAIKTRSTDALAYLVSNYGVRQAMNNAQPITVRVNAETAFRYSNVMIPLILQGKDNDSLACTLKQEGFVLTPEDFRSFVAQTLYEGWIAGLRTFLFSSAAQFLFTSFLWDEQRQLVDSILGSI
jgi:hypothetical protein